MPIDVNAIRENPDDQNWDEICEQELTIEFMKEFNQYLNWTKVCIHQNLTTAFIDEFNEKINWLEACRHQNLSTSIMKKYKEQMFWDIICLDRLEYDKEEYRASAHLFPRPDISKYKASEDMQRRRIIVHDE